MQKETEARENAHAYKKESTVLAVYSTVIGVASLVIPFLAMNSGQGVLAAVASVALSAATVLLGRAAEKYARCAVSSRHTASMLTQEVEYLLSLDCVEAELFDFAAEVEQVEIEELRSRMAGVEAEQVSLRLIA